MSIRFFPVLAVLLPLGAQAKPLCDLRIDALAFDRVEYEAGEEVYATVQGALVPTHSSSSEDCCASSADFKGCVEQSMSWFTEPFYHPLDAGMHTVHLGLGVLSDGRTLFLAGKIDPQNASGAYRSWRASTYVFQVKDNPHQDTAGPMLSGLRLSPATVGVHQILTVELATQDQVGASWVNMTFYFDPSQNYRDFLHLEFPCQLDGSCRGTVVPFPYAGRLGRYTLEQVVLYDRLGVSKEHTSAGAMLDGIAVVVVDDTDPQANTGVVERGTFGSSSSAPSTPSQSDGPPDSLERGAAGCSATSATSQWWTTAWPALLILAGRRGLCRKKCVRSLDENSADQNG